MVDFFYRLFDTSDFPPRWMCGSWQAGHGWFLIASDIGVALAYLLIPLILLYWYVRGVKVPYPQLLWLFAAFIVSCGLTHVFDAVIFWWPVYRFVALLKFITAILSWTTVLVMAPLVPQAFKLKSPNDLEAEIKMRVTTEARLNAIISASNDGVIVADAQGHIVHKNRTAGAMFGYSPGELVGAPIVTLMPVRYRARHELGVRRFMATGESLIINRTVEMVAVRKDGQEFPVELSVSSYVVDGQTYFVAYVRDITHRKQDEEQLRINLRALQEEMTRRLTLETEITTLKTMQENQTSQLSLTSQSIDKLNGVTVSLARLLNSSLKHDDAAEEEEPNPDPDSST